MRMEYNEALKKMRLICHNKRICIRTVAVPPKVVGTGPEDLEPATGAAGFAQGSLDLPA